MITLLPGNPMRVVLLSILIFEVIAFGLAIPVMIFTSDLSSGVATTIGVGGALLAIIATAMMRKPVGYLLGWVTQLVAIAMGFANGAMFIVGGMFMGLWIITFVLGKRLDAAKPGTHPDRVAA